MCFPWLSFHWAAERVSCHGCSSFKLPQSQRALSSTLPFSSTSSLLLSSLLKSCCFNYHLCADESQSSRPFCSHSQFRISFWIFATSPNAACWKDEITFLPKPSSLLPTPFPYLLQHLHHLMSHKLITCVPFSTPLHYPHKSCRFPSHCHSEILALSPTLFNSYSFLPLGPWHPHSILIPCPSTLKPELICLCSNPLCFPPSEKCVRTDGDGRKQNCEHI